VIRPWHDLVTEFVVHWDLCTISDAAIGIVGLRYGSSGNRVLTRSAGCGCREREVVPTRRIVLGTRRAITGHASYVSLGPTTERAPLTHQTNSKDRSHARDGFSVRRIRRCKTAFREDAGICVADMRACRFGPTDDYAVRSFIQDEGQGD
jgi:hypothetical protein